ncbi:MAG: protein kinase [Chloroflexota bacterium]
MKYQKSGVIGEGAIGTVYRAVSNDGDQVALKELILQYESDTDRERFAREIRILSKLEHDDILPLLDYDLQANPPWFVTPLAICSVEDILKGLSNDLARAQYIFREGSIWGSGLTLFTISGGLAKLDCIPSL